MVERGDGLHFAVLGRTGIFNLFSHPPVIYPINYRSIFSYSRMLVDSMISSCTTKFDFFFVQIIDFDLPVTVRLTVTDTDPEQSDSVQGRKLFAGLLQNVSAIV
jgi:hypothetical protein